MSLVRCLTPGCGALYDPEVQWDIGYFHAGTSGRFTATSEIPLGNCPICRQPQRVQNKGVHIKET